MNTEHRGESLYNVADGGCKPAERKEKSMGKSFNYEWWTVEVKEPAGKIRMEFKGKSKESVVRQIKKYVKYTNSDENLFKDVWHRQARILEVYWDTLTLDRVGYQRRF